MRRWSIPLAVMLTALWAGAALAQGGSTPPAQDTATMNVWVALTPILAAATAVERTLEAVFNFIETTGLRVIGRLAMGVDWLEWAVLEVNGANNAIRTASAELRRMVAEERQMTPGSEAASALGERKAALLRDLDAAEGWLRDSEKRLQDAVKSTSYVRLKQVLSLTLGVIIGTVFTLLARLDILLMLGLNNPYPALGYILTGFIVGTGTGPVHSLIGLLEQSMNTLYQVRGWLSGKAIAEAAQAAATMQGAPTDGASTRDFTADTGTGMSPRRLRSLERLIE